ncbi:MAG: ATP-binding cassette domain-containing protein, partial [Methylocystis sp.]
MNDIKPAEILKNSQTVRAANHTGSAAQEKTVRLDIKGAYFSFGSHSVLRDVDIKLRAGEIFGLLGPNGAGKTTLMKAMCGRIKLDKGQIRVAGRDPR